MATIKRTRIVHMNVIAKLVAAALLLCAAGTLSACNTISGVGDDVGAVGSGISKTADQTQKKM